MTNSNVSTAASIIDVHAHIFRRVAGRNRFGVVESDRWGCVRRGGIRVPLLPESCANSDYPVEALIELMNRNGVARAILLQNPTLGLINDYIAECLQRFPERFLGTIQLDPRFPEFEKAFAPAHFARQCILKVELSYDWGWSGLYPDLSVEEPQLMRLWEAVEARGWSVIVDPGPADNPGYQIERFERLVTRFSATRWVFEHLGYPTPETMANPVTRARRQSLLELARHPNVWLGLSAVPILMQEGFPCPATARLLHDAVELVGADKLLWGSDLPTTLTRHTYGQLLDVVRAGAGFLTETQKRLILHDNALRVWPEFHLPAAGEAN